MTNDLLTNDLSKIVATGFCTQIQDLGPPGMNTLVLKIGSGLIPGALRFKIISGDCMRSN